MRPIPKATSTRSAMIVTVVHLIQTASSLPTDASALESAISALEREINTLESSSVPWEHALPWFTALVAFGVALELWVIWRTWRDEMHAWGRGIICWPPNRPSTKKFIVEIVSVLFVTGGIVGELWAGVAITSINGVLRSKSAELRSKSDQLLALVTQEAGDAKVSAEVAAGAAEDAKRKSDAVAKQADALTLRIKTASEELDALEHEILIQGPRWKLLESGKGDFITALKPFRQKVLIVYCGRWGSVAPEPFRVAQDLMNFLGKNQGAGWDVNSTTWDSCSAGGATSAGGNLIITSSIADAAVKGAATALYDALNKIEVSTIKIEADPRQAEPNSSFRQFLGPGSPWKLPAKDPTSVILLVGTNPMFDLAGWKKRQK